MTHLSFTVDARERREHRFAVALELDVHPHGGDLELLLPVWTPGSYLVREHERHLGDVRALGFSPRGDKIQITALGSGVTVYDLRGTLLLPIRPRTGVLTVAAFLPEDELLAIAEPQPKVLNLAS